jgi:hypothetical protein
MIKLFFKKVKDKGIKIKHRDLHYMMQNYRRNMSFWFWKDGKILIRNLFSIYYVTKKKEK